jgi:hypothetical protein
MSTPHQDQIPHPLRWSWRQAAVVAALTGCALASELPDISMMWLASDDPSTPINFNLAEAGSYAEQADGTIVYSGNMFSNTWQLSWTTRSGTQSDVLLDTMISVTNTSSTDQWFTASTLLDSLDSSLNENLLTLAATVSVLNMQFSGDATISSGETSLITSSVDGVVSGGLFESVYALTAAGPFGVASESDSTVAMLNGIQSALSQSVRFNLTAGDTATLHTISTLSSIPAPGGLAILACAAGGPVRRRRRSSRRRSHS